MINWIVKGIDSSGREFSLLFSPLLQFHYYFGHLFIVMLEYVLGRVTFLRCCMMSIWGFICTISLGIHGRFFFVFYLSGVGLGLGVLLHYIKED